MAAIRAALAVVLLAVAARGSVAPSWYTCDPATCKGLCTCPSDAAPGGLLPAATPQFVLLTHDDAVTNLANLAVRKVTDGFKNPNGCNIPATWFVTQEGSDCKLIQQLAADNHELAVHTVHHAQLSPGFTGLDEEMMGVRDWMEKSCGIPRTSVRGFRAPYLVHNEAVRQVLAKHKMLYDSSIEEPVGRDIPATKTFGQRLWPYTMDSGLPQLCNWTYPAGSCTKAERYPGLWEVPMWDLPNATENTESNAYTMDYGDGFGGDAFTTLQTNFDAAYTGNRAPFPIYIHAPWIAAPGNASATMKFIQYALSKPDVYFVTMQQLIRWMRTPVPAAQVGAMLTCKPVNLTAPVETPCQEYTVKNGDYLDEIAGRFGVADLAELVALNPGLTPTTIQPGQKLRIPPWDASCGAASLDGGAPATAGAPAGAAPAVAPKPPACKTWTVQAGQYLYSIATQTSTSVADLAKANNILTNAALTVGQVLKVPPYNACCDTNSCVQPVAPAPLVAPAAAPAAAVPEVVPPPAPATAVAAEGLPAVPPSRAVLGFYFGGMGPAGFDATARAPFVDTLAQRFNVSVGAVTAAVVPVSLRKLLQGAVVAVDATVATEDPLALYDKLQADLTSGELASALRALGLELKRPPRVELFKDNVALALPTPVKPVPVVAAAADAGSSGGLPLGAIVGIAVGGALLVAALAVAVVVAVRRRRRRHAQRSMHTPQRSGIAGGSARLSLGPGYKDDDKFVVVNSGSNTPTTPMQRHGGAFSA